MLSYIEMLHKEQNGQAYSKTEYRRNLLEGPLRNRSPGAIEYRMQNISSVLRGMKKPWMKGYKPAKNVGKNVEIEISNIVTEIYEENTIDPTITYQPSARRRSGPSKGPSPRNESYVVEEKHPDLEEAYTYIARFGKTDIFKIGYSNDPARRLGELNKHIPSQEAPQLEKWEMELTHKWNSILKAYGIEQALLKKLVAHRTEGERVQVSPKALRNAWDIFCHI